MSSANLEDTSAYGAIHFKDLKNHKSAGHKEVMEVLDAQVPLEIEIEEFYATKQDREDEHRKYYGDLGDVPGLDGVQYISSSETPVQPLTHNLAGDLSGFFDAED